MCRRHTSGFTMIELVMTIVLLGIIGAVLAPVIQSSVAIYAAERSRSALVQKGRLALERIAREVREAVPNSLSEVVDAGGNPGIEFVQIVTGGRYIDITDSYPGAFVDNTKRFTANVGMSDLYSLGSNPALAAGDLLIIANADPLDLFNTTTVVTLLNIVPTNPDPGVDGTADGQILNFATPPATFTFTRGGSMGRRYFTANTTHEIGFNSGALYWHRNVGLTGYSISGDWSPADPMLVDGVTALDFKYDPGAAIGVAVLRMTLSLTDGTESINLFQEIQIRNSM